MWSGKRRAFFMHVVCRKTHRINPAVDVCVADGVSFALFQLFRSKTMRRSLILSTVLAASVAILGACDPKTNTAPNKPTVASPSPSASASVAPSPSASPSGSPVKAGSPTAKPTSSPTTIHTPEGIKTNRDDKPAAATSPKAK